MDLRAALRVEVPDDGHHRRLVSCQQACPVHTDARGYVRAIAEGRFEEAYLIARGPNPFASICGRVCGAPCEAACRRGKVPRVDDDGRFVGSDRPIAIRALKRFVCEHHGPEAVGPRAVLDQLHAQQMPVGADAEEMAAFLREGLDRSIVPARGERVAIVGAGPAGLSAAHDLALLGLRPVVYEMETTPAGMLALGVPAYRLPREVIQAEIAVIEALGAEIRCGVTIGEDISFGALRRDHAAVVLAVGAKRSRELGLPGERGPGVLGGVDLLRAVALGESLDLGARVVVVGGGNVAYDVARTVVRQAASDAARTAARLQTTRSVTLVSLETLEEMPADTLEILEGDEEGIVRLNGYGPLAIERDTDGTVRGIRVRRCVRVYDTERRFAPVYDDGDQRVIEADTVLLAVGQAPNLAFLGSGGEDVEMARPGWPRVDPRTQATTAPGVFVAGDLAHGTRLLIDAVASGKRVARAIYEHVTGRALVSELVTSHHLLERYRREQGYERIRRTPVPVYEPEQRLASQTAQVERGYDRELAVREASRCLDCGVTPVFDGTRCVLCGGCVDVCPTECLKLVPLSWIAPTESIGRVVDHALGSGCDLAEHSAILKDEDRCIRCALCALRCPVDAIGMERVCFTARWTHSDPVTSEVQ